MGCVGYAVVYAVDVRRCEEALEAGSLSLAADDWRDAVSIAYLGISRRFGVTKALEDADDVETALV